MDGDKNVSPFRASAVDLGGKSSRETFDVILPHEVVEYFELKPWARWQELSYVDWSGFCLMDTLGNILGQGRAEGKGGPGANIRMGPL